MSRFLYSLLLYVISPLVILRLYIRAKKAPEYLQGKAERFGFIRLPKSDKPLIWVHSVSVGETIASVPLIKELQKTCPDYRILITTMTPTGSAQVKKIHGNRVEHVYACYDFPDAVSRFLNRTKPEMAIVIDTELWPNTIAACHQRRIPVLIANARLSERSANRYSRFSGVVKPMLQQISMVAAQNNETGQRFLHLGLPKKQLSIAGSIKFDLEVSPETISSGKALRHHWQQGMGEDIQILIAASTHDGEDQQVLNAYRAIQKAIPKIRLLLVPRHPERFDQVFQLIEEYNLVAIRHSEGISSTPDTQVILGDTMGEMMTFFAASDIAFVGGSLVPTGGHNMLEPAALGLPVLSGLHVFNFEDISQSLINAGGMKLVDNSDALATAVINILQNNAEYKRMSHCAQEFVESNRGALERVMMLVKQLLTSR